MVTMGMPTLTPASSRPQPRRLAPGRVLWQHTRPGREIPGALIPPPVGARWERLTRPVIPGTCAARPLVYLSTNPA